MLKARLDRALSNLVWYKVTVSITGGWEVDNLEGPFQPKPFSDKEGDACYYFGLNNS